jgi:hypothetical protein
MILRTQVTFSAAGDHFTPSKVEAPFTDAHDPGEIGRAGRYRGIPDPNGYASFDAPEDEPKKIEYLHRIVVPLLPALHEAGAEDFWLRITYHGDSGAIGFSKEEIKMLAELQCDVPIDCIIEEEPIQGITDNDGAAPRRV